jgi:hypothetical protein
MKLDVAIPGTQLLGPQQVRMKMHVSRSTFYDYFFHRFNWTYLRERMPRVTSEHADDVIREIMEEKNAA